MHPLRWLNEKTRIDGFMLAILAAAGIATLLPATGSAVPALDAVVWWAIFLLFFLYGARLAPREALAGLTHWRLHALILAFTYVVFPAIGLLVMLLPDAVLAPGLRTGMVFVTLVPSTVQSSIAFTSIGRGNVAGAIVSASLSNLLGTVLTPLLVLALMTTSGQVSVSAGAIGDIGLQLLLPFVLGQLARPLVGGWVTRHNASLKYVDRGSIVLVVYSAFSAGMREGIWHQVGGGDLLVLLAVVLAVLAFMLWLTAWVPQRLGFVREDVIAIQFCGTKKSLATGLPMATVLFASLPVGLVVLPLMLFHQVQLMACSALAARYARDPAPPPVPSPAYG